MVVPGWNLVDVLRVRIGRVDRAELGIVSFSSFSIAFFGRLAAGAILER